MIEILYDFMPLHGREDASDNRQGCAQRVANTETYLHVCLFIYVFIYICGAQHSSTFHAVYDVEPGS